MLPGLLLIQGEVSSTHALDRQIWAPVGTHRAQAHDAEHDASEPAWGSDE
jgi:hypothetical protein